MIKNTNDLVGTHIIVIDDISPIIFPFGEIDLYLLIYMHYLFMDCQNIGVKRICIVNLRLIFSVLIATKMSAFPIFFSNSDHKELKYYTKNIFFLTFTVFIEARHLINF